MYRHTLGIDTQGDLLPPGGAVKYLLEKVKGVHRGVLGFADVLSPPFHGCCPSSLLTYSTDTSLGHCDRPPRQREELETANTSGAGWGGRSEEPIMAPQNTTEKHIPEIRHLEKITLEVKTRLRP